MWLRINNILGSIGWKITSVIILLGFAFLCFKTCDQQNKLDSIDTSTSDARIKVLEDKEAKSKAIIAGNDSIKAHLRKQVAELEEENKKLESNDSKYIKNKDEKDIIITKLNSNGIDSAFTVKGYHPIRYSVLRRGGSDKSTKSSK